MIHRASTSLINFIAPHMPVLCMLGPRQAGKTTLSRCCFPTYYYVPCDEKEIEEAINAGPAAFLRSLLAIHPGVVIDEFQRCPRILDSIRVYVDETGENGRIVLTGSQNYLMMAAVTQSLAGRVILIDLLPLSIDELSQAQLLPDTANKFIFKGGYPRLYINPVLTNDFVYTDYMKTYLERDIRTLKNVPDLGVFHAFIKLCAGRVGQQLNINTLAADAKISVSTAQQWITLLEACYIICLLRPHYKNFNKTVTKSPKLYFVDTGLATYLLDIHSVEELEKHSMRGALFENMVITECFKWHAAIKRTPSMYFWRDEQGNEIDLIISHQEQLIPVEIKSASAPRGTMIEGLKFWQELTGHPLEKSFVIYAGESIESADSSSFVLWQEIPQFLSKLLGVGKEPWRPQ